MKGYPVFWFLQNELGTTLIHFTIDDKKTLCGLDCKEWYGDDDLAFDDVECKRCRSRSTLRKHTMIKDMRLAIALALTREFAWQEHHSRLLRYLMSKYNILKQDESADIIWKALDRLESSVASQESDN